jgi:hypothetical protein
MGKRELLIIVAFIAVGLVAYQLTAPPAKEGTGFSLSRLWQNTRRSVQGNPPMASETKTGTLAVAAGIRQLRIGGVNRVLQVSGEDRKDIGYELTVESNGSGPEEARELARRVEIVTDDLGEAIDLRVTYPKEGRQWGSLILHVPARLDVRIDHNNVGMIHGVHALEIESSGGTITANGVVGAVSGYHRNAEITVTGAGSMNLTLAGSRAKIMKVTGPLSLNARSGRCELTDIKGPIDIEGASQDITIVRPLDRVRITGRDGKVTIDNPGGETRVEVRTADVQVTLRKPIVVTLLTADRPLRLFLDSAAAVAIDAVATDGGRITSEEFALAPIDGDHEQRLQHNFGAAAAPRVTLRNLRGNIVIAKAK